MLYILQPFVIFVQVQVFVGSCDIFQSVTHVTTVECDHVHTILHIQGIAQTAYFQTFILRIHNKN